MRSEKPLFGQAVRFININRGKFDRNISLYDLVRGIEERYKFVESPQAISQVDFNKGVVFRGGHFKGSDINLFQMYGNGVVCESAVHTHLCDELLDDVIEWVGNEIGISISENIDMPRIYASEIEFQWDYTFDHSLRSMISDKHAKYISNYRGEQKEIFLISAVFGLDPSDSTGSNIRRVTLERRQGRPVSDNCFFSHAPLTTADHLNLLIDIENEVLARTAQA